MRDKTTDKHFFSLGKLNFDFNLFLNHSNKCTGILYTLFSYKDNLIEVGFAKNSRILGRKLLGNKLVLLDKKEGHEFHYKLLKETLREIGLSTLNQRYYKYSESIMKHLDILSWPIGNSLYKRRRIRKELSCTN